MNRYIIYLLLLVFITNQSLGQNDSLSSVPIRVKRVSNQSVKIKLIPRNYMELKGIGNSNIQINVTPLIGSAESPKTRNYNFTPAEKSQWEKFKTDSNVMICAQLLYGTNMGSGNSMDEQIKSTLELQENLFVLSTLGSAFSWDAAKLLNIGFDLPLHSDSIYSIEVIIPKNKFQENSQTIRFFVSGESGKIDENILLATESKEHGVLLSWLPLSNIAAYDIFIAETESGEFKKLNPLPYNEVKNDTFTGIPVVKYPVPLDKNYQKKYFKVCGYDLFGEIGYCSEILMNFGKDLTPPKEIDSFTFSTASENHAEIKWDMPVDNDRNSIRIYYSNNYNGPYTLLEELKKDAQNFTHLNSNNILPNYYKISTVDTANNENSTTPIMVVTLDTIAPNIVSNENYSIDDFGNIEITWEKSNSPDNHGYRIATSTQANGPWVFLTTHTITDTFFRDTINLKNLRGDRYYGIKSVDFKGNFSTLSKPVKIKLPDKIAPSTIVGNVHSEKNGTLKINLKWPSEEDLKTLLIRRMSGEDSSDWISINEMGIPFWIDSTAEHGKLYQYQLKLIDNSGNESIVFQTEKKQPLPKPISANGINVSVNLDKNNATILWNRNPNGTNSIKIWRKVGNNPFYLIGNLDSNSTQYVDNKLNKYMSYTWAVQFKNKEGSITEKIYSDVVFIR